MDQSRIASRIKRIKPSPSTFAADRANELKRQGRSIISLVVGEPDFDTPAHIRQAASLAMDHGQTRYTPMAGTIALREAIIAKLKRENLLDYAMNEIIATNGAKSGIYAAFAVTLEPGDEVIVPTPYWVSYTDMAIANDGVPVTIPCPETQDYKLLPAQLEAAITDKTRWLLLNTPSNPTGVSYSLADFRALADVLLRHPNMLVMTDDIYEHIRFDNTPNPHFLTAAPELKDRTLAINGVSKTYAMTGFRIGWVAGPKDIIHAINTFLSQSAGNCCSVSQAAAVAALNGDQSFIHESVETYQKRRDQTAARINAIKGLHCRVPKGAFYLYVNCQDVIGKTTPEGKVLASDDDLVMYLLDSVGVAVVAGTAYGLSPYFRMSIATSLDTLDQGTALIAEAIQKLN